MLTLLFLAGMLTVFGKLCWFAIKMAWGLAKVLSVLVFLPLILLAFLLAGFVHVAWILLVVIGIISLVKTAVS